MTSLSLPSPFHRGERRSRLRSIVRGYRVPTPPSVTRNRIDWAGLGWLFLFFWFFSGITQLLLLTSGNSGFSGFRNAMVLSTIWLAPVLLFPRWTKPLAAVIGLVLWAASLVGLSYFGIYHQEFSQSVIFVMSSRTPPRPANISASTSTPG